MSFLFECHFTFTFMKTLYKLLKFMYEWFLSLSLPLSLSYFTHVKLLERRQTMKIRE